MATRQTRALAKAAVLPSVLVLLGNRLPWAKGAPTTPATRELVAAG